MLLVHSLLVVVFCPEQALLLGLGLFLLGRLVLPARDRARLDRRDHEICRQVEAEDNEDMQRSQRRMHRQADMMAGQDALQRARGGREEVRWWDDGGGGCEGKRATKARSNTRAPETRETRETRER